MGLNIEGYGIKSGGENEDEDYKSASGDNQRDVNSFSSEKSTRTPVILDMERGDESQSMKCGYLWKRSTNLQRSWQRRWFFIRDGKLFYTHCDESPRQGASASV